MKNDEMPNIGSRLELFVDRTLADRLEGADFKLHAPQRAPLCHRWSRDKIEESVAWKGGGLKGLAGRCACGLRSSRPTCILSVSGRRLF